MVLLAEVLSHRPEAVLFLLEAEPDPILPEQVNQVDLALVSPLPDLLLFLVDLFCDIFNNFDDNIFSNLL